MDGAAKSMLCYCTRVVVLFCFRTYLMYLSSYNFESLCSVRGDPSQN